MPKTPKSPEHRIDPAHNGDGRAVRAPERDSNGRPMTQKPYRDAHGRNLPPGHDHITIINKTVIVNNIRNVQNNWNVRDHDYHWHDWDGYRMCHYYDTFGFHWWGFYIGDVYFWARYYNDYYWWYDPYWHRWVYMHDGRWWWTGPNAWVYIYLNGVYYHYDSGNSGVIMTPDPAPPVDVPPGDPAPAPVPNETTVYSLDGTRSVQISGDNKDAFLFDQTAAENDPAAQGRFLASGVKSAAFINDGGAIREIVLTVVDESGNESTMTFDRDGAATGSSLAAAQAARQEADATMIKTAQEKVQGSAAFKTLANFSW